MASKETVGLSRQVCVTLIKLLSVFQTLGNWCKKKMESDIVYKAECN